MECWSLETALPLGQGQLCRLQSGVKPLALHTGGRLCPHSAYSEELI